MPSAADPYMLGDLVALRIAVAWLLRERAPADPAERAALSTRFTATVRDVPLIGGPPGLTPAAAAEFAEIVRTRAEMVLDQLLGAPPQPD